MNNLSKNITLKTNMGITDDRILLQSRPELSRNIKYFRETGSSCGS